MPDEVPVEKKLAPPACQHQDTEPAERDRWRRCLDCFQVVHRSETAHFRAVSKQVI